ncbi:MAG: alpha/beta fold hydrolase [Nevskiales bacterium]
MPYAELPGVRLHYEEAGAGPPLVLLHGIGASCKDWEYNIPAFARDYRVIAPDLRGFGRSERSGNYSVATFASDIWHLLDQLQVERFHLIGHSMGGAVALQMAVDRPQRLSSAVAGKLFPGPHQQALRDRATAGGMANDRGVYLETLKQLLGWSVLEQLDRLIMPVLVLAAEHDYFPVTDAEVFARALHDAHLKIFAGMHHAVPLEAPQAFNTAVLRFLTGQNAGRALRRKPAGDVKQA